MVGGEGEGEWIAEAGVCAGGSVFRGLRDLRSSPAGERVNWATGRWGEADGRGAGRSDVQAC